jgi:hypothetical protein
VHERAAVDRAAQPGCDQVLADEVVELVAGQVMIMTLILKSGSRGARIRPLA